MLVGKVDKLLKNGIHLISFMQETYGFMWLCIGSHSFIYMDALLLLLINDDRVDQLEGTCSFLNVFQDLFSSLDRYFYDHYDSGLDSRLLHALMDSILWPCLGGFVVVAYCISHNKGKA